MKSTTKKKLTATATKVAAAASGAGQHAVHLVTDATDDVLVRMGEAAKERKRTRTTKAALKQVRKAALLTGVAAAAVLGVRAAVRHRNGKK